MAKPGETLIGTDGDDTLRGKNSNDIIRGGLGIDSLYGGNGQDDLSGDEGIDTLYGGNGKDTLSGGLDDDTLYGDNGKDALSGDDGNDTLYGGNGVDTLLGGDGDDRLDGGRGGDHMSGGDGNDTYVVDSRPDKINESPNEGLDTVETSLNKYTLGSNLENLDYTGSKKFSGTGNELDNQISGGSGNDILAGNGGNDTLNGEAGNDKLIGGLGDDVLNGGDGADLFLLNALTGIDTIQDFTVGVDKIALDDAVFTDILNDGSKTLDDQFFVAGPVATTAEQHVVYDSASGNLYKDNYTDRKSVV